MSVSKRHLRPVCQWPETAGYMLNLARAWGLSCTDQGTRWKPSTECLELSDDCLTKLLRNLKPLDFHWIDQTSVAKAYKSCLLRTGLSRTISEHQVDQVHPECTKAYQASKNFLPADRSNKHTYFRPGQRGRRKAVESQIGLGFVSFSAGKSKFLLFSRYFPVSKADFRKFSSAKGYDRHTGKFFGRHRCAACG